MLLPVQIIASAPAVLGDPDTPVLVTCEHAVRSKVATRLLAQAGFTQVYELAHGMALWDGPRAHEPQPMAGPSPWLFECGDLIPRSGRALDVACGRGRHALLLASTGLAGDGARSRRGRTRAPAGAWLTGSACRCETRVTDLETGDVDLGEPGYDARARHALPAPPAAAAPAAVARAGRRADLRDVPRQAGRDAAIRRTRTSC